MVAREGSLEVLWDSNNNRITYHSFSKLKWNLYVKVLGHIPRVDGKCKGRPRADAKTARSLCLGAMINTELKPDCSQKNRTECRTSLASAEQHTGTSMHSSQWTD